GGVSVAVHVGNLAPRARQGVPRHFQVLSSGSQCDSVLLLIGSKIQSHSGAEVCREEMWWHSRSRVASRDSRGSSSSGRRLGSSLQWKRSQWLEEEWR